MIQGTLTNNRYVWRGATRGGGWLVGQKC